MPTSTKKPSKPTAKPAAKPTPKAAATPAAKPAAKPAAPPAPPAPAKKPAPATATDPGQAALASLHARLMEIPAAQIKQPRLDARAAAAFVLSQIVPKVTDAAFAKRLQSLPKTEFDFSAVAELKPAAQACVFAFAQLSSSEAQRETIRLPLTLIDEATDVKARMLRVCTHQFEDHPQLGSEVADIRAGSGYLDLAEDLIRLSALYRNQASAVALDGRFYDKQDVGRASLLAARITSELKGAQGDSVSRDIAWRALTLLQDRYDEVAAAARFLERSRDGERLFPTLYAAAGGGRRRRGKAAPMPDAPEQPEKPH